MIYSARFIKTSKMNSRSALYRVSKYVALQNGVAYPNWRTSTILSLRQFYNTQNEININRIRRQTRLPFLTQIKEFQRPKQRTNQDYFRVKYTGQGGEALRSQIHKLMNNDKDYYVSILDDNNRPINLRRIPYLNRFQNNHPYFELKLTLDAVMSNDSDYNISTDYVNLIFHQQINTNPLLVNQRHSDTNLNCAVKIVLDLLKARKQTNNNKSRINQVMKINETYYKSGINNEGLQLLSNKSQMHLIVKDKLQHIWHEFKPQSKGFHQKVLMFAHNNHLENLSDPEPYDSEDEEEPETSDLIGFQIEDKLNTHNMRQQEIVWFDNTDDLVACALPYEQTNTLGHWILSKSEPVGYIASNGTT